MSETVLQELSEGLLTITLNRPAKKNSFNNEQWRAFTQALLDAQANDHVSCVLITGAGNDFSSGVDLSSFGDMEEGEEHPFEACSRTVAAFDKPLIMAAKGVAIGGGATLTFHADLLYVGESLRMRLPFVNLGLVPEFASSYILQQNIGAQRAAELFYTAEWIDASRAVEVGIAARSYPDDELLERATEKAREIAQWPVNSLRETKRTLKIVHEQGIKNALKAESDGMAVQAGSPENIEAITAFMEKRKPDFSKLIS